MPSYGELMLSCVSRLRAVPLRSVTSKLGRTGESEFTRARKARVRSERKPRGSWGEGGKGGRNLATSCIVVQKIMVLGIFSLSNRIMSINHWRCWRWFSLFVFMMVKRILLRSGLISKTTLSFLKDKSFMMVCFILTSAVPVNAKNGRPKYRMPFKYAT